MAESAARAVAYSPLNRGEVLRKVVHMAVGLIAFTVVFLGPRWSALCAVVAILSNLFLLPLIGGRKLWRSEETERGMSYGIVFYPTAVLILILLFWQRLEVAAAVWGILAFGDGMASLFGMAWGRNKLPWNPRKSWLGTLTYWLFGTLGASVLLWWTLVHQGVAVSLPFLVAAAAVAALFAAFIESQPLGLDDNLSVPVLTGLVLLGLLQSEAFWTVENVEGLLPKAAVGAAFTLLLAVPAYLARSVDISGALAGFLVGTTIYTFLGWRGFLVLVAFFVLGTGATKLGYRRKAERDLAQEKGGRRSARHTIANVGVPTVAAVLAATTGEPEPALLYLLAFAGAFATATGDTLSSEIGQLWGRRTFLITNLRPVPRGTEGAVSLEGTLAGIAGSALIAALGWQLGFYPALGVGAVTLAAIVGTTLESLVGATLEKRGLLDNEAVNFFNTFVGALAAAGLWIVLT